MSKNYIIQNMQQSSKLNLILLNNNDTNWYFEKEKHTIDISFNDLFVSDNKHYMVVAEPGYGKTRLLKEIIIQTEGEYQAFFLDAKKIKRSSIEKILMKCKKKDLLNISEEELQKLNIFKNTDIDFTNDNKTIVCIDALDEVSISDLYQLLEKIEEFIDCNKGIKVFLSCRTHHLKKVSFDLESLDLKFLTLAPFNRSQVKKFLETQLDRTIDLDSLYKKSKLSNLFDFISIPRYLYYFSELLKEGSVEEMTNLSRAIMFEHFIYRKLNKELQESTEQSQIDLLKRVLEKLAFIMKIDGVSEITKDELMTIFDKMDSNFSQIAFRNDLIQKLYDRSLIKDNIKTIEFENQEFLDYLAAKELARFEKVEQVFFDVAVEAHILELYPSWFYVLPFVFELHPLIIEPFLNFLDINNKRIFSMEYFQVLLSIEPESISKELKSKIFDIVFDYHVEHTKWLDTYRGFLSRKLYRYYDESKYHKIKDTIDARKYSRDNFTVLRTNAIRLISLLIEDNRIDENKIKYWQNKATQWLKDDVKKYRVLHENIIEQFANLSHGDFKWIKKHRFIFETGVQVQDEYARACFKVAPNDFFSIDVYLDTDTYWNQNKDDEHLMRANDEYDYILQISDSEAMRYALSKIWQDESYYYKFCENLDRGVSKNTKLEQFKENFLNICDKKLLMFTKELLVKSMDDNIYHNQWCNGIYRLFIEIILQKDNNYITEYIGICEKNYETGGWYYCHSFFDYISIDFVSEHFDDFNRAIANVDNEKIRSNILEQIYYSVSEEYGIKEKIRLHYSNLISKKINETSDYEVKQKEKACSDWIDKIEPEPNKFKTDLFKFFIRSKKYLQECDAYNEKYKKTIEIAKEVLENNNPLLGKVEQKENGGATIWQLDYYKSCIDFVYQEKIELSQDIRDNVFRYLPIDINSDYEITLKVAKTPSPQAIQDIIDVYAGKRDDALGVYHVRQFVQLYNKLKVSQFEPVLLEMLKNESIAEYERVYIAQSLPKDILTRDIIKRNKKYLDKESSLHKEYLSLLISKHEDHGSIEEAFEWTKMQAKSMEKNPSFDLIGRGKNLIPITMTNTNYSIEKDKELLLLSSELFVEGKTNGSNFLHRIVEIHLKYLIDRSPNAHEVILDIEKFLDMNKDKQNLHWFEYTIQDLKQAYLSKIKESNIVKAVKKYNKLENEDYLPISSIFELRELVKNIIDKDIRRWIEDEGAYKHIQELAKKEHNTNAEEFIQKSIKSQIELALVKRGFRDTDYSIIREEQILDDKRLDFTVRYGFIGSVMIELKLGHRSEAKATTQDGKKYVKKLQQYMFGTNSEYGLFVVFNVKEADKNTFKEQIQNLNKLYESVDKISVLGLDCV